MARIKRAGIVPSRWQFCLASPSLILSTHSFIPFPLGICFDLQRKMKTSSAAVLALATAAHALPSRVAKRACDSAVTLDASTNVFQSYTLHANSFYRGEVEAAIENLSDPSLADAAAKVADVGSFLWL